MMGYIYSQNEMNLKVRQKIKLDCLVMSSVLHRAHSFWNERNFPVIFMKNGCVV